MTDGTSERVSRPAGPVLTQERRYFIGLDLGQKQDYTALAVIERAEVTYAERDAVTYDWRKETRFRLRDVERLPLGTPYPDVARAVRELLLAAPLDGEGTLVVDATGVGGPVVDLLREQAAWKQMIPVLITAGERVTSRGQTWHVPKRELVTGLQVAFEERKLEIAARAPNVGRLVQELMSMRLTISARGHDRYESWRAGEHDDMVLAVALAWWKASQRTWDFWGPGRIV